MTRRKKKKTNTCTRQVKNIRFFFIFSSPLSVTRSRLSSSHSCNQLNKSPSKRRFLLFKSLSINTSMGGTNSVKRSQNDIQAYLEKEKEKFIEKIENPMRQNGQLDDFELIRTIGTGSFGK